VIEGHNEASSAVSGDYYDYFDLEDGRIGFIIADVTGHGLPAALIMANLQSALRIALATEITLPNLAMCLNKLICRNTASHVFITAAFGVIDLPASVIHFVGAGHPLPVLMSSTVASFPEDNNSLPLGIDPDEEYTVTNIELGEDLRALLFYTDGMVEAAGHDTKILGLEPVVQALGDLKDAQPHQIIHAAREIVREHLSGVPNTDDMTLLAIRLK